MIKGQAEIMVDSNLAIGFVVTMCSKDDRRRSRTVCADLKEYLSRANLEFRVANLAEHQKAADRSGDQ